MTVFPNHLPHTAITNGKEAWRMTARLTFVRIAHLRIRVIELAKLLDTTGAMERIMVGVVK